MAETGSELREKLEAALAENQTLRSTTSTVVASAYKHVRPEDLEGVDPSELIEKAKQVEAARIEERKRIFEETAKELGIDINVAKQATPAQGAADAASRIASLGSLTGTPMQQPDPAEGLTGRARLEAVIQARNERRGVA